jgi:hypothetical protein
MTSRGFLKENRRGSRGLWLDFLRRYVSFGALANLLWEFAQLPLYTIWEEGNPREIIFAAIHCTGGDIMIATSSLLAALLLVGNRNWPQESHGRVAVLTCTLGLGYTVFSEWLNTEIRGSWAYTDLMPVVPWIGSGVAPLAQWIVIPLAAFWWARRSIDTGFDPREQTIREGKIILTGKGEI